MRTYSERFKKEVVKKALTPGIIMKEVCQKLNIDYSTILRWKKIYATEVQTEAENIVLATIQAEEEEEKIDIDELLAKSERQEMSCEKLHLEETIDRILKEGKLPSKYKLQEKYAIVNKFRSLKKEEQGRFFRRAGLRSQYITLWEEEILSMGKKEVDKSDYIKKLEDENKTLNKKLKELERDKDELQILIKLKKKYTTLFKEDGED